VKLYFNNIRYETDVVKEWENLQNILKSAAHEILGIIKK
jgi:DNA-binding transcriptional regulator YiaG